MWTLFVVSIALANGNGLELKYREVKRFESQWACNNAADRLDRKLKDNEATICYRTSNPKKVTPNVTY
jgi:hypothetical protein